MRIKWLDRRVAKPGPYLALCLSQAEFEAALRQAGYKGQIDFVSPGANATTHTLYNQEGSMASLVCLGSQEGRTGIETAGLLVHEAVHVWQHYAETMGEDRPGTEQEAYAVQSIAQNLMDEYARRICG